jgi:hypothetical protein
MLKICGDDDKSVLDRLVIKTDGCQILIDPTEPLKHILNNHHHTNAHASH